MTVTLTIKKDKRNIYCGHVFFMDMVLIEHGRSYAEVKQKIETSLQNMYEISAEALNVQTRSHHVTKALNGIWRLKRKQQKRELEVSFNSAYFV